MCQLNFYFVPFQEDGNLLQVLGLPDRDAMRAGVERCCRVSGDSCFILNDDKDRFALAHFTGEYEYAIDEKWIGTDQMQVVGDILQASFRTCSCDLVVGMAQVSWQFLRVSLRLVHTCIMCRCRICATVQMCCHTHRNCLLVL